MNLMTVQLHLTIILISVLVSLSHSGGMFRVPPSSVMNEQSERSPSTVMNEQSEWPPSLMMTEQSEWSPSLVITKNQRNRSQGHL